MGSDKLTSATLVKDKGWFDECRVGKMSDK
jgi:hypothetical protein